MLNREETQIYIYIYSGPIEGWGMQLLSHCTLQFGGVDTIIHLLQKDGYPRQLAGVHLASHPEGPWKNRAISSSANFSALIIVSIRSLIQRWHSMKSLLAGLRPARVLILSAGFVKSWPSYSDDGACVEIGTRMTSG